MSTGNELYTTAYQLGAIVGAFAIGLLAMWARASKTATGARKDQAERDIIATLGVERDKAMAQAAEAWRQRTSDAKDVARLTAENESLHRDIARMAEEIAKLRRSVDILRAMVQRVVPNMPGEALSSGHAPLEGTDR